MQLRFKYGAAAKVVDVDDAFTVHDLYEFGHNLFAIPRTTHIGLFHGFPPKQIDTTADGAQTAAAAGIKPNAQIEVRVVAAPALAATAARAVAPPAAIASGAPPSAPPPASSEWPCTACTFLNSAAAPVCEVCGTARASVAPTRPRMERHVVPADNSCLFTAVGYMMDDAHSMACAPLLRRVVVDHIRARGDEFTDAILGKPVAEYCTWLLNPTSWGGAIECTVLARHLHTQIVALDVRGGSTIVFGEDGGYALRMYLLWDGIHYDAMKRVNVTGLVQTLFEVDDTSAAEEAAAIAGELRRAHAYTDTQRFTLRCGVCAAGVVGQQGAMEHATATGHTNFAEYS